MEECRLELAGLKAIAVGDPEAELVVVMLHGREMTAADLAPFAHSLQLPVRFVFPQAPIAVAPQGRSWWPIDPERRAQASEGRPSDLFAFDPPGRHLARHLLGDMLHSLGESRRTVLAGFSQGGMLAMDYALHDACPAALALLSSSRIAFADWQPRLSRLAGLPMLIAHGKDDKELAFSAGQALRDAALTGGADVQWLAFDGGHTIPLPVWRALRKFVSGVLHQ